MHAAFSAHGSGFAAAASYRELIALRPADADLLNNLSIILARSGDLTSAAEQFAAAQEATARWRDPDGSNASGVA